MSTNEHDDPILQREGSMQQRAEQPASGGMPMSDPVVDRYRYVYHALRAAPLEEPPADFAAQMEQMTRDFEESAAFEAWMVRVIGGATGLMVLWMATAVGASAWPFLMRRLAPLPWALILAVTGSLALAWVLDRWLSSWFASPHAR